MVVEAISMDKASEERICTVRRKGTWMEPEKPKHVRGGQRKRW